MMPDCVPVRIAQAVAAEINAAVESGELSEQFIAEFSFASEITAYQDLNDDILTVDVIPTSDQECAFRAAGMYRHYPRVAIGIRRRIAPIDRTEDGAVDSTSITTYVNLLYAIFRMFAGGRNLTTEPTAAWDNSKPPTISLYDPDMLKDGLYFGWIHLPFIVRERMA